MSLEKPLGAPQSGNMEQAHSSQFVEDEEFLEFEEEGSFQRKVDDLLKKQHSKKALNFWDLLSVRTSCIIGSWTFVWTEMLVTAIWICVGTFDPSTFDPPPFVLLNFILSFQAEFAAPFIVMSQRLGDAVDRSRLASIRNQVHHSIYLIQLAKEATEAKTVSNELRIRIRGALMDAHQSGLTLAKVIKAPTPSGSKETWLDRLGDEATDFIGHHIRSWNYIIMVSLFFAFWLSWNSVDPNAPDPYPFSQVNLALTISAAINSPLVMMSSLRQAALDRKGAGALQLEVNDLLIEAIDQLQMLVKEEVSNLGDLKADTEAAPSTSCGDLDAPFLPV